MLLKHLDLADPSLESSQTRRKPKQNSVELPSDQKWKVWVGELKLGIYPAWPYYSKKNLPPSSAATNSRRYADVKLSDTIWKHFVQQVKVVQYGPYGEPRQIVMPSQVGWLLYLSAFSMPTTFAVTKFASFEITQEAHGGG